MSAFSLTSALAQKCPSTISRMTLLKYFERSQRLPAADTIVSAYAHCISKMHFCSQLNTKFQLACDVCFDFIIITSAQNFHQVLFLIKSVPLLLAAVSGNFERLSNPLKISVLLTLYRHNNKESLFLTEVDILPV